MAKVMTNYIEPRSIYNDIGARMRRLRTMEAEIAANDRKIAAAGGQPVAPQYMQRVAPPTPQTAPPPSSPSTTTPEGFTVPAGVPATGALTPEQAALLMQANRYGTRAQPTPSAPGAVGQPAATNVAPAALPPLSALGGSSRPYGPRLPSGLAVPETRQQQWDRLLPTLKERAQATKEKLGMDQYGKVLPWMTDNRDRLDSRRQAVVDADRLSDAEWGRKYPGVAKSEFRPGGQYHLSIPSKAISGSGDVHPVREYYSRDFWRNRDQQVKNFRETGDREFSLKDLEKSAQDALGEYAGKKFSEEGKQEYSRLRGSLQSILNQPLRARQKSKALQSLISNIGAAGLDKYEVKDESAQDLADKNFVYLDRDEEGKPKGQPFGVWETGSDGRRTFRQFTIGAGQPTDFASYRQTPEGRKEFDDTYQRMADARTVLGQPPPSPAEVLEYMQSKFDALHGTGGSGAPDMAPAAPGAEPAPAVAPSALATPVAQPAPAVAPAAPAPPAPAAPAPAAAVGGPTPPSRPPMEALQEARTILQAPMPRPVMTPSGGAYMPSAPYSIEDHRRAQEMIDHYNAQFAKQGMYYDVKTGKLLIIEG